jgi:hypothetical protein
MVKAVATVQNLQPGQMPQRFVSPGHFLMVMSYFTVVVNWLGLRPKKIM